MSVKVQAAAAVTGVMLAGLTLGCTAAVPPGAGLAEVVRLTGKQLAAALRPASDVPSGVAVFRASGSGGRVETGARVDLATAGCGACCGSLNGPGPGGPAFASRSCSIPGFAQQFIQAVDQQ